jgi:hypothetical protein
MNLVMPIVGDGIEGPHPLLDRRIMEVKEGGVSVAGGEVSG